MLGLYPGVGLYDDDPDAALLSSIVNNPNYTASVAGTNVATTRATGLLCPFTGATLANNVPCTRRIYLGGKAHDAFGAWPQTAQIIKNSLFTYTSGNFVTGWLNFGADPNSMSVLPAETVGSLSVRPQRIASTVSGSFGFQQTVASITSGTYTISIWLKRTGTCTGAFSLFLSGCTPNTYVIADNTLLNSLSVGVWTKISKQITITSGSATAFVFFVSGGTGTDIAVALPQFTLSSVELPFVPTTGTAQTVNADAHVFTVATDQIGAVLACAVPIYWSIGAGVAHPSGQIARKFDSNGTDYIGRDTNAISAKQDSGSESASASGLALSASVPMTSYQTFDGSSLTLWRNGSFVANDNTLSGSWAARSSYIVGNTSSLNRAWSGLVLLGVCNGFIPSSAAMAAWHRSVVRALTPLSVPIL
jgi:hypothetical protein